MSRYVVSDETSYPFGSGWHGPSGTIAARTSDGQLADPRLDRPPPPTDIGPAGICCSDCSLRPDDRLCDGCPRRRYNQSRWAAYAIDETEQENEQRRPWWRRLFTNSKGAS